MNTTNDQPPAKTVTPHLVCADSSGHRWSIATHKQNLTNEQIVENARAMFGGPDCK